MHERNEAAIRDRLVEHGQALLEAPCHPHRFTQSEQANLLLNDLDNHPHAFVVACIMDRQIKAERAFMIPFHFQQKLGDFSMKTLLTLAKKDMRRLMSKPEPLHRFVDTMSDLFFFTVHRIAEQYGGNASTIWSDRPSSATVVYRFLEFDGVGPKIATMAANILARRFKIPFTDHFSIDISADVHVKRVFGRLGLTPPNASIDQLVFRARGLYPKFPGVMDFPTWEIGRSWCRPRAPECDECYMKDLCPSAGEASARV